MDFAGYELVKQIAVGGMCEVFLARRAAAPCSDPPVVIKRLMAQYADNPRVAQLFLHESEVSLLLNHPNVVRGIEHADFHGLPYLVLEYVDGPDLADVERAAASRHMGFGFPLAIYVCLEVLHGLHHAHAAAVPGGRPLGLIHRDVTPENILVRGDGRVKLADFGIVKLTSMEAYTGPGLGVHGKLSFLAPERLRGEAYDARADQFSAGLILYELCTGQRAFAPRPGETEEQTMDRARRVDIVRPRKLAPDMPRRLENVIMQALEEKPRSRFKSCQDLADVLLVTAHKERLEAGAPELCAFLQVVLADRGPTRL